MALTYIDNIPHRLDPEVMRHAVQIFQDSRTAPTSWSRGNDVLKHCEDVAVHLVRTYTLMDNEGGQQNALLYAKVADLFGALWYFSAGCARRIEYRHLQSRLFPQEV